MDRDMDDLHRVLPGITRYSIGAWIEFRTGGLL